MSSVSLLFILSVCPVCFVMGRRFVLSCLAFMVCVAASRCAPAVFQDDMPDREQPVDLSAFGGEQQDNPVVQPASMTQTAGLLAVYSILIVLASLAGGWLPSRVQLTHTRMQTVISLVGGLMLGIGVFHLLPHAVNQLHSADITARWMMVGIVMMFVLMRLFHFHNHEPIATEHSSGGLSCDHDHDHDHDELMTSTGEGHSVAECHTHSHSHGLSWMGIAFGLSLHTLIDGLALGASVHSQSQQASGYWLFGFGTFLAIVFHKPLDAVSITSLMMNSGWSKRTRNLVNGGFAMMCPLGAVLFLLGVRQFAGYQQELVGTALAFAAGVFICIALSDLLPEMEFHSHNKVQLTVALGLGIAIAWLMTLVHPSHL